MGDFTKRKRPAAAALVESTSLASSASQSKKTKVTATVESVESKLLSDDRRVENRSNFRPREVISVATTSNSGDSCSGLCSVNSLVSRDSGNESLRIVKDGLRFVDLEAKNEVDISSACINGNKFREKTPSMASELPIAETANEPPSEAEIEEFFSGVEKQVQKRFAEKYNYDIVKDVPLEGRYRWVRLKRCRKMR